MKKALSGVQIKSIMSKHVVSVSPNLNIKELVDDYFFKYRHASFPVVEDDAVKGLVTLHDVKHIHKDKWETTHTKEIMRPIEEGITIKEEADAINALGQMANQNTGRLLVIKDDHLVGIVSQRDITRLFEFKEDLDN